MELTQQLLKSIPIFSKLTDSELLLLKDISSIKLLGNDEILFYEGDESLNLHILLEGIIRVFKTDTKGKEIILQEFQPFSFIGEVSNYSQIKFPASSKSINDSTVLKIDYKKFEEKLLYNTAIAPIILKSVVKKVVILEKIISQNLVMSATQRVAKFIYENENSFLNKKHHELANRLNITPVTFSRVLKELKNRSIISADNRIVNKELLKKEFS